MPQRRDATCLNQKQLRVPEPHGPGLTSAPGTGLRCALRAPAPAARGAPVEDAGPEASLQLRWGLCVLGRDPGPDFYRGSGGCSAWPGGEAPGAAVPWLSPAGLFPLSVPRFPQQVRGEGREQRSHSLGSFAHRWDQPGTRSRWGRGASHQRCPRGQSPGLSPRRKGGSDQARR